MRAIDTEVVSQPDCWLRASACALDRASELPADGERVLVLGCGTSNYMGQAYARAREDADLGVTDAVVASELANHRSYDRVVALSRSGTTTEVLRALDSLDGSTPTLAVTAVAGSPLAQAAGASIVLDFADETAVVQTRFATSALALLLTSIGRNLNRAVADARKALTLDVPDGWLGARMYSFLGTGWTVGLANEAALKMREAALAWSESYPALEFRHGPISVAGEDAVVWSLGEVGDDLLDEVAATGAIVVRRELDPLAELVRIHRLAIALAHSKGLDPEHPPHLTRSVVLPG
jgi:fructoselysine-6-P-deglycase FrlB-like protein